MRPTRVLGISLSAFLAGDRNFTDCVRARPAAGAAGLFLDRRQAGVVRFSTSCGRCSRSARRRPAAGRARDCRACPKSASSMSGALDRHEAESNGDLLANVQDPVTPPSLLLIEGVASPAMLEAGAEDLFRRRTRRHPATRRFRSTASAFPMCRPDPPTETGDAPVYMSAYGGFGHCGEAAITTPRSASCGWSGAGSRFSANIRGGGEFGPGWHEAGRRAGRASIARRFRRGRRAPDPQRGVTRADQSPPKADRMAGS